MMTIDDNLSHIYASSRFFAYSRVQSRVTRKKKKGPLTRSKRPYRTYRPPLSSRSIYSEVVIDKHIRLLFFFSFSHQHQGK